MNSNVGPVAARRFRISGRVQGVYFRASTAERAIALGLRGFAENRDDGSVLVLAAGDPGALERLGAWLRTGPPLARVDGVDAEPVDPDCVEWPAGFQQR